MTEFEHAQLVQHTCKKGADIILDPIQMHMVHMALGIAGEAGELVDAIKKHAIYNRPMDLDNIIEELGDLEWYMEGLRARLHITREHVLRCNINKLKRRYELGYSDTAAQERADKK